MDICHVNAQVFIHSTIEGISKPKTIPTGDQARYDIPGTWYTDIWYEIPGTGNIIDAPVRDNLWYVYRSNYQVHVLQFFRVAKKIIG